MKKDFTLAIDFRDRSETETILNQHDCVWTRVTKIREKTQYDYNVNCTVECRKQIVKAMNDSGLFCYVSYVI